MTLTILGPKASPGLARASGSWSLRMPGQAGSAGNSFHGQKQVPPLACETPRRLGTNCAQEWRARWQCPFRGEAARERLRKPPGAELRAEHTLPGPCSWESSQGVAELHS